MTRTAIPNAGIYTDPAGRYWARPWINHRRTWKLLRATTRKAAIKESATISGTAAPHRFNQLAQLYLDRQCPNKRLEPRPGPFTEMERPRIAMLVRYFGRFSPEEITLDKLPAYKEWRVRQGKRTNRTRLRAVDKDLQTLSNILRFAVNAALGMVNLVASGRPRYQQEKHVRHCRTVAPANADVIHTIAAEFFQCVRSEVFGWLTLHAYLTGCRTSELMRLRLDSARNEPGHFEPSRKDPAKGLLHLGWRSKHGIDPYYIAGPEFIQMRRCFLHWHQQRFPDCFWYFPGADGIGQLDSGSFSHAMFRITRVLAIPQVTPHGLRSFYVTKRRSDGASDTQIAGEIGDKTVALMQTTYGKRPPNWFDGEPLTWLPEGQLPAWLRWRSEAEKIVPL